MRIRITRAFAALALFGSSAFGSPSDPPRGGQDQTGYAGSEACVTCHDQTGKILHRSAHRSQTATEKPGDGCESCHGPGLTHADDPEQPIFAFRHEPPREKSARCLSCHATGRERGTTHGIHERSGVSCDVCHSSGHSLTSAPAPGQLRRPQPELCVSCHSEQGAQARLPFRHRTADGVMRCSDCHDAHGRSVRQVRRHALEEACYRCHTDKQGPFVFEHLASRVTGCASCHQPHGSTNPRLLTRSEVRFVCLECHPDTSGLHDMGNARFQNCTVCHGAIHGSHVDRRFFR